LKGDPFKAADVHLPRSIGSTLVRANARSSVEFRFEKGTYGVRVRWRRAPRAHG
jgi:hypothetical protein